MRLPHKASKKNFSLRSITPTTVAAPLSLRRFGRNTWTSAYVGVIAMTPSYL